MFALDDKRDHRLVVLPVRHTGWSRAAFGESHQCVAHAVGRARRRDATNRRVESIDGGHYASADVGRLLGQANLVLKREETRTVLRVANAGSLWIKGPAEGRQQENEPRLRLVVVERPET